MVEDNDAMTSMYNCHWELIYVNNHFGMERVFHNPHFVSIDISVWVIYTTSDAKVNVEHFISDRIHKNADLINNLSSPSCIKVTHTVLVILLTKDKCWRKFVSHLHWLYAIEFVVHVFLLGEFFLEFIEWNEPLLLFIFVIIKKCFVAYIRDGRKQE